MAVFRAFKPTAMNKIAQSMGYTGDMGQFQDFIEQDPARQARMEQFKNAAVQMARGGMVRMQQGGTPIGRLPTPMVPRDPNAVAFEQAGGTPSGTAVNLLTGEMAPPPDYSGMTFELAQSRQAQRDVKTPEEAAAIQAALARGPATSNQFGLPTGMVPQQGVPTMPIPEVPEDPYAKYRKNVEVFPETGAFKNPQLQGKFDTMLTELGKTQDQGGTTRSKSDKIVDYLKAIYQGPAYVSETGATGLGSNFFTEDFSKFAQSLGIQISNEIPGAADSTQVLSIPEGNPIVTRPGFLPAAPKAPNIKDVSAAMIQTPGLPAGATTMAAQMTEQPSQIIDPRVGVARGDMAADVETADLQQATADTDATANLVKAQTAAGAVGATVDAVQAATTTLSPEAQVVAAQQTASSVGNLEAAQGNAILLNNPVQRQVQAGELISGVANAQTAAQFTEQIQAAEATPSRQATVQGQLEELTANFDSANPPAWAAGALRNATAVMAQRGLGASSIAGQAIVQATIEAALPIAQADAATLASFEQMNLSNRQQRSMLAAEQRAKFLGLEFDQAFQSRVQNASRIADVANQNFTAEQQIALENSRIANTMNINNLSNRQAIVLAEASALANMDLSNLSNRQQASVQNAQNFLQTDMANLTNKQQTELFRAQQRVQSLFTDQAALNAAQQFNASSQNQLDQFFANLNTQTSQYNASQYNAQEQFNAGQINAQDRFNTELANQRDQFNAQNQLVIAQNNAQWRRQIATANTAAVNRANEINADAVLEMSRDGYDNLWNYYADTMEWAWTSAEAQLDRYQEMAVEQLRADKALEAKNIAAATSSGNAIGNMIATLGSAAITGGLFG